MSQDKFYTWWSNIDFSIWIKKKKGTINPKDSDDKWIQHAVTVALDCGEIKWNPERISNIKPLTNKYSWKGINNRSKIDNWKMFEKNNPTIALNISYIKVKEIFELIFQKLIRIVKSK